jgi:hypothetical protein
LSFLIGNESFLLSSKGDLAVILDVGANAECDPSVREALLCISIEASSPVDVMHGSDAGFCCGNDDMRAAISLLALRLEGILPEFGEQF